MKRTMQSILFAALCATIAAPVVTNPSTAEAAARAKVTSKKKSQKRKKRRDSKRAPRGKMNKVVQQNLQQMFGLSNRVALVTGANRGIGKGIAISMAQAGATVALMGRNEAQLKEVKAEIEKAGGKAVVVTADVTKVRQVKAAVAKVKAQVGDISILVNNAGIADGRPTSKLTKKRLQELYETNVFGAWNVTKAVLPQMKRAGGGNVINLESTTTLQGSGLFPGYAFTKGANGSMTMSWGKEPEFIKNNIKVNGIVPGFIDTDLSSWVHADKGAKESILTKTPMGRLGTAQDVGTVAVFLASPASGFMTGSKVVVDGGITISD